jgi:chemotaxis protein methyltransferase CheR
MKRVMIEYKLGSLSELVEEIKHDRSAGLRERIIEAMTTNETSWFRDIQPYDSLKQTLLPEIAKQNKDRIRIWSAACSSGQEPYSIAITAHEFQLGNPGLFSGNVEIIATDISPAMLKTAQDGVYDDMSLARGINDERRKRYFTRHHEGWQVSAQLRSRVAFRELNLLQSYALLGKFDIIFCRNVLIYFSRDSKADILNRMARCLNPGGYLFLGGSESMTSICDCFEMMKMGSTVVYKNKFSGF